MDCLNLSNEGKCEKCIFFCLKTRHTAQKLTKGPLIYYRVNWHGAVAYGENVSSNKMARSSLFQGWAAMGHSLVAAMKTGPKVYTLCWCSLRPG